MFHKDKKNALLVALLCTALFMAACQSAREQSVVLNVYNWGDYIDEDVLDMFTEETGIKINYETFDTNESMYAKMKAGGTNYDICIPSDYMIERMNKEDMLLKIDFANIPNYEYIDGKFKNLSYDANNEYSVPYMWGTLGIVYNTNMVDDPVDSWDILWNEKYEKQIIMYDSQRDSIAVALRRLGYSLNTRDENEIEEAKQLLIEQKPLVLSYSGDLIKTQMVREEAALAVMYSGDAMLVTLENPDLAYAIPKEGSNKWFDAVVIPKGAQHKTEAEMFINFLCRPDIALANTEYITFSTPNAGCYELLPEELKNSNIYFPTDEELDSCDIFNDLGDFITVYDSAWTVILSH